MRAWYINLERRPNRHESIYRNLMKMGFIGGQVCRLDAIDRDKFDTPEALVAGAVDDGFGEFKDVLDCPWILQYTGYMHSYLRALRDISDQDGDVLLMEDDYHLIENRSKLMKSVEELDDDWKLAMLGYNVSPDTLIKRPPYGDSKFWQVGPPNNGNSANIYSPAGAADVLQRCLKDMGTTPECVIQKMVDVQGVYSRVRGKIAIKNSPMMGEGNVMDGRW